MDSTFVKQLIKARQNSIYSSFIDKAQKEHLQGGDADNMSVADLAKKHNVDKKIIEAELAVGMIIEQEHTNSEAQAKEIAMDHIAEYVDYYTNPRFGLIEMERKRGE